MSDIENESDIVPASETVWKEIHQLELIILIVGFYLLLKVTAPVTNSEIPYLMTSIHEDQWLFVPEALLGYGLIGIGVSYLKVSTELQNTDRRFTTRETNSILSIPFATVNGRLSIIGYVLIGTGVGMITLSIMLMLTTYIESLRTIL